MYTCVILIIFTKNNLMKKLFTILTLIIISCSSGIEGEISSRSIEQNDRVKMNRFELKKKYSKEALKQFDWYSMSGCKPELQLSDISQMILINTSKTKKLRYTINKTITTYPTHTDNENCHKPIIENPKVEYDDDYETLRPGEIELLGIDKGYINGNYVEIEYELAGALEE